ncbi:MAG: 2-oxoacid:acceptor oxidoreductase subunit alpha [Prevotellaceae bacterium]|jgi:2-oxoglutarate ferredoxin oxidoreductase subunit alpha|nr:2-oxoacid:acceptor oxidoreductase subunit alpha [Prevotellaceae bacterium]
MATLNERSNIVIRFSGDSGDGMQLTGTLFSDTSALLGYSVATFPDYPAEIRAPQGTVAGVSGFQVHIGDKAVNTPGDYCDVLVAMNPAALKANAKWAKKDATIILDVDTFDEQHLLRAGFATTDPIKELKLEGYNVIFAPISSLTKHALEGSDADSKTMLRSKNMFALGICYYLFNLPLEHSEAYFESKFKKKPALIDYNKVVLKGGYNYAANTHAFANTYKVAPAQMLKGVYRMVNGNVATAWGLIAAAEKSGLQLFCGSYPITPATGILEELAARKNLGVVTMQAEDEIAGICTAIGAAFAGNLAVTSTSGPGLALKGEAIGLAVMTELPLVIVDVQRSGPSTGIPTKTEQSDLMQALYGRNGESPAVVMAASSPSDCFNAAFYAAKIALEHMTPVILLTDGFIANGSEPWRVPSMKDFPSIVPPIAREGEIACYMPYQRDEKRLARQWAIPGTKGYEHRVGGLEKDALKGSASHDPQNHQKMTDLRAAKVERVAEFIPEQAVVGEPEGDLLVVGWGGTYGHLLSAVTQMQAQGKKVSLAHFNHISPLPRNTEAVLSKFKKVVVCELNMGQFAGVLRMKFPHIPVQQYNKVQGLPFTVEELVTRFEQEIKG